MAVLFNVLLVFVSRVVSSTITPPPEPSGVLYNCVVENWGNGKETAGPCILCFAGDQGTFLERAVACSEQFLPTVSDVCSGVLTTAVAENQKSVEDVIECFDDTLENMTAERCLRIVPDNGDVVEVLAEGALCLTEARHNATLFIEHFLGVEEYSKIERKTFH
eukprot:TRINITY_DN28441_c0_g1_i1.p1 TRINITY_DN28441_c0_g1~~TRINITY_DN28441_c0_g1_i1.p1  ORF type:complete len:185 (-),score=70.81 TRINITY_DN28441_c0_g1_i1:396-884(-)